MLPQPTDEMIANFEKRTRKHIKFVADNLYKIYCKTNEYDGDELLYRADIHDDSKYGVVERIPYIWLTEFHRCRNNNIPFKYPPGVEAAVQDATRHHILSNRHHPEYHADPTDMSDIDIIEMVCDWGAMSRELGDSLVGWADKNVGTKWEFSEPQVELIYKIIDLLGIK